MKKIAIFGGSFNPAGVHHRDIVAKLAKLDFAKVYVIPCGPRPDKPSTNDIPAIHRAVMADKTFHGISDKVEVLLFDLENGTFTRNHEFEELFAEEGEVWHVVGTDLIKGGASGASLIQKVWRNGEALWRNSNFAVITRRGYRFNKADLPPRARLIRVSKGGSSEEIRLRAFRRKSLKGFVLPDVEEYVVRNSLYLSSGPSKKTELELKEPRLLIVYDKDNVEAAKLRERFLPLEDVINPNLVVSSGGDGTMLHAIKENWRRRIPFFGINKGRLGFLLNDIAEPITASVFRQKLILRHSPLLHIEANDATGKKRVALAFNDAAALAFPGKSGWFEVSVDGEVKLPRLVGDGALVSTAAGSTGWARAMGANPVPLGTDLMVVVGSNVAEPLNWRSGANIPLHSEIDVRNCDPTGPPKKRPIFGFADGVPLGEILALRVRVSKIAAAELAFLPDYDIGKKLLLTQFPKS